MAFAALFADSLYCPEEHLDLFQEPAEEDEWGPELQPAVVVDDEVQALLEALRGKEEELMAMAPEVVGDGGYGEGREAAVGWAAGAAARLGFSALTAALATAYLDRCFLALRLRLDGRPWMARLAAVACVALAAKVEETRVPVLLDLQLCAAAGAEEEEGEGEAYVFEPKTVLRMELLVLSTLAWRMHPVTPFSFLHPLALPAPRLQRCETALLAAMPDRRWPRHRPSSWAAAALLATTTGDDAQLLALINAPEDEVAECAKILNGGYNNKRRRAAGNNASPPLSPSGVIAAAAFFSSESSADSWPPASVSSSPGRTGRLFKRAATIAPDDAWP